jgi:hypothetical protein
MKKTLITLFVLFVSIALTYGLAHALSGQCSNCHTMHNSQNGEPVALLDDGSTTTTDPNPNLTISTCIGCHNGGVSSAPNIFGSSYLTDTTAGGTFAESVADADTKLHNVADLVDAGMLPTIGAETTNTGGVPGNDSSAIDFTTAGVTGLNCAGALGCHGDHTVSTGTTNAEKSMAGIKGFHHAARDAERSSKGYRFLEVVSGNTPVEGKGSSDWELSGVGDSNHNVYSANQTGSISDLCAQCHGVFHGTGNTGSSSPFERHPTENIIPSTWDGQAKGDVNVSYTNNPFAFDDADATFDGSNATGLTTSGAYDMGDNPRVACVSCHRAHGTPNEDLLRFAYSTQNAGGGSSTSTGCLGCHTLQR